MLTTHLRRRALVALLALPLALIALPALATAPAASTTAPGFQRMKLGSFEVTALSDGTFGADYKALLKNISPAKLDAKLGQVFLKNPVPLSVNAYLINTGTKLVLIDTGSGNLFGPTLGFLGANLKAAGYTPDQVDEIYITHFHPDHVGGLANPDGSAVFTNAIVRADKRESDYWLSDANLKSAPAEAKAFFQGARKSLSSYVESGKFKPFNGPTQLVPGISAISTIGHKVGHTTYVVQSQGERLVLWGDLVHAAALQFPDPNVAIVFDTNSAQAIASRKRAFADAATSKTWVGASHISFPGLGHVVRNGTGYEWIPANYAPVISAK